MNIKVNYDAISGEVLGFYPEDIKYVMIPKPHVEIDENTYLDCINNQGNRKIDIQTKTVVIGTILKTTTKDELLTSLDVTYRSQFAELSQELSMAILEDNASIVARIKNDYAKLKSEYETKRSEIDCVKA